MGLYNIVEFLIFDFEQGCVHAIRSVIPHYDERHLGVLLQGGHLTVAQQSISMIHMLLAHAL